MKKELLKKLLALAKAKDSGVSADEVAELEAYDPQAAVDAAAAAARKDAEGKLKKQLEASQAEATTLKEQLAEAQEALDQKKQAGDGETAKLTKQLEKMQKQLDAEKAEREKIQTEARQAKRDVHVQKILKTVKTVDGVDPDLVHGAVKQLFADMSDEDLADDKKTGPVLDAWRGKNKGILADPSKAGTGHQPQDGLSFQTPAAGDVDQKVAAQSPAERQAALRKMK